MKISELLDKTKEAAQVESDYKLAMTLGISKARVSDYRNGKSFPDAYAVGRIADILKKPTVEVLAIVQIEAEKSDERRIYWQKKLAERIAASLMVIALSPSLLNTLEYVVYYVKFQLRSNAGSKSLFKFKTA